MLTKSNSAPEHHRVLRVLVVDPSVDDARRVHELLRAGGEFSAHVARSADEACALLSGGAFDAAVVDYELWSDRDGEIARCIREEHGDMAVVLLTNGENEREALPALKLGAHDFLSKQHLDDHEQLAARILAAVDESRASRRRDTMVRWLEREARTDHLTGMFNRRAFDDRLREACDAARASNTDVTVVVVDVTGTRTVNDVHGHEVGDNLIRRAASGVSRCVRARDFAARVGGDDFGIIIEGDIALGRLIARRIAQEVERLNAYEWDQLIPITLAFGVASGRSCHPAELFAAADRQVSNNKAARPILSMLRERDDSDGPFVA